MTVSKDKMILKKPIENLIKKSNCSIYEKNNLLLNQTKVFDCIEDRPTTEYIKNKLSTICGKKCNKNP